MTEEPLTLDDEVLDFLERVADGILVVDRDGRIVHATRRLCDLFGYEPHELRGQCTEVLVPVASRAVHSRVRSEFSQDPHEREMGTGLPLEGLRRDGTVVELDIRLEPMANARFVVASVRPTVARPSLAELTHARHREQELRVLLDHITQHLFAVGMSIEAVRSAAPEAIADRLTSSTDLIDKTIDLARVRAEDA